MFRASSKPALVAGIILGFGVWTTVHSATDSAAIEAGNLRIEFDRQMHSRVIARFGGRDIVMGPFAASETITLDGAELTDFTLISVKEDSTGGGKQTTLTGTAGPLL